MSAPTTPLICPRHKVETPLTCVTCETPICPQCYVRTAVGLRCPKCGEQQTIRVGGRSRLPIIIGVLVLIAAAIGVLALRGGGGSGGGDENSAAGVEDEAPASGAAAGYRLVSMPAQGYSVEVPVTWHVAADNSDTTLAYNDPRANEGSLRVSVDQASSESLTDRVTRLMGTLQSQGGVDFARTDVQVSGVPAVKLTYRFPVSSTPGASLASRASYLLTSKGRSYSFQLATTDPGAKESVFAYMASKFTLL